MTARDLVEFGNEDLRHRLLHGGLPPFFLEDGVPEEQFQEWLDAYWAKDIQELFRLGRRHSFQKFLELLIAQSGGVFEATRFARPCEVSRPTINNYLSVSRQRLWFMSSVRSVRIARRKSSRRRKSMPLIQVSSATIGAGMNYGVKISACSGALCPQRTAGEPAEPRDALLA